METDVNDNGGVIAIDKDGNLGIHFNTPVMVWASVKDNELKSGMRKDEVYVKQL
jgi:isoaspartyl peptidase/L-asparaginase-like protein (Ntn-hydrolase superfamily)